MGDLHVKKRLYRVKSAVNGLTYSFHRWEVRQGTKLVKRFDRRCDAYAYRATLEAALSQSAPGSDKERPS